MNRNANCIQSRLIVHLIRAVANERTRTTRNQLSLWKNCQLPFSLFQCFVYPPPQLTSSQKASALKTPRSGPFRSHQRQSTRSNHPLDDDHARNLSFASFYLPRMVKKLTYKQERHLSFHQMSVFATSQLLRQPCLSASHISFIHRTTGRHVISVLPTAGLGSDSTCQRHVAPTDDDLTITSQD